jgi:hypothetical protein
VRKHCYINPAPQVARVAGSVSFTALIGEGGDDAACFVLKTSEQPSRGCRIPASGGLRRLERDTFHGDWNYRILCGRIA